MKATSKLLARCSVDEDLTQRITCSGNAAINRFGQVTFTETRNEFNTSALPTYRL